MTMFGKLDTDGHTQKLNSKLSLYQLFLLDISSLQIWIKKITEQN